MEPTCPEWPSSVCLCVKLASCGYAFCFMECKGWAFERSISLRCEWRNVEMGWGSTGLRYNRLVVPPTTPARGCDAREVPRMNERLVTVLGLQAAFLPLPLPLSHSLSLYMHTPSLLPPLLQIATVGACSCTHFGDGDIMSTNLIQHGEQIGQESIISGNQLLILWIQSTFLCSGMCHRNLFFECP